MIRIYAILGLVIALLATGLYAQHLRASNTSLSAQVDTLQAEKARLVEGLKAVETVNKEREQTRDDLAVTRQKVERETDAPLPAPLERALDGLREHQLRTRRPR